MFFLFTFFPVPSKLQRGSNWGHIQYGQSEAWEEKGVGHFYSLTQREQVGIILLACTY